MPAAAHYVQVFVDRTRKLTDGRFACRCCREDQQRSDDAQNLHKFVLWQDGRDRTVGMSGENELPPATGLAWELCSTARLLHASLVPETNRRLPSLARAVLEHPSHVRES
jgi:hypothetical protein